MRVSNYLREFFTRERVLLLRGLSSSNITWTRGCNMKSKPFGWFIDDGIICPKCGESEPDKEVAEAVGYPDGFTCLLCGDTVGAENYEGE